MSELTIKDFKVGMKVSFINTNFSRTPENIHVVVGVDITQHYVQIHNGKSNKQFWLPRRFKIVDEPKSDVTFDYLQAMKHCVLDQDIELEYEGIEDNTWITVNNDKYCMFPKDRKYRFKPDELKPTFQFLIKAKGKYSVTKNKYEDEDQVKKGYSYPVEVIQKLED